ncbi:MAG: GTP 3',8-cyclase MoaA [Halofilum sp. (in: g-proteobacteria)]
MTCTALTDQLDRPLQDLRISVTDRCNFRCTYCMPKEQFGADHAFLPRNALLDFEEIERLVRVFAGQGVRKIRLTGGEPLVRKDIERLVERIANVPGIDDIALTTNGSLLSASRARALADAGLERVTISLDSLDDATFMAINDVGFPVDKVLKGIDNASEAGLSVKINAVIQRGVNEHQILPMAGYFRGSGHILRFIEFMDVGTTNGWCLDDVVSAREIRDHIDAVWPIEPADPNYPGEVANRWRYRDGTGEVGIIASVTQPFCRGCTRARLSAEGSLYTCLFAGVGYDLRGLLRSGADDARLVEEIAGIWSHRADRYSELRSDETVLQPKVEMSYIGG